jgi:hypothetical protein
MTKSSSRKQKNSYAIDMRLFIGLVVEVRYSCEQLDHLLQSVTACSPYMVDDRIEQDSASSMAKSAFMAPKVFIANQLTTGMVEDREKQELWLWLSRMLRTRG